MNKRIFSGLAVVAVLGLAASGVFAGVIATNASVPAVMNAGGTSSDPAIYLYDSAYIGAMSNMRIGSSTTSYNQLQITAGSSLTVSVSGWTDVASIGSVATSGYNSLSVSGSGSTLTINSGGTGFKIGSYSSNNTLSITNGSTAALNPGFYLGTGATGNGGSYNSIVIDAATATSGTGYVGYYGSNNTLSVVNVGSLSMSRFIIGNDATNNASDNGITVSGLNSKLYSATGYSSNVIGTATSGNNTLTVANSGLVQIYSLQNLSNKVLTVGAASGNYVRLADGFLAMSGNRISTNGDVTAIQVWDGTQWVAGVRGTNYTATYYSAEDAALAATGYSGLAGYTIFTGGTAIVPEPTTMALLVIGGIGALVRRRRK